MPYKDKEGKRASDRRYEERNREKIRERNRKYSADNKAKIAERKKRRRQENIEVQKPIERERCKRYYGKNRSRLVQAAIQRQKSNPEKYSEIGKKTRKKNHAKRLLRWKQYVSETPNYEIAVRYTTLLRGAVRAETRRSKMSELLGISIAEFRNHISKLFKPRMTWENWGEWELDHIKPCSAFNLSDSDQLHLCFHYTNFQPLWKSENLSKYSYYNGIRHSHKTYTACQ